MTLHRLGFIFLVYITFSIAFLTLNARGNWDFVLSFRGTKLIGITMVAIAISCATVLFQTISQNRILTPSIMGFDSLYILLQTMMVFFLGGFGFASLPQEIPFFLNFTIMMLASLALFGTLLGRSANQARQDLHRLLLTGIIFGVFFRSITSFIQRVIDPNDFVIAAASTFADFNTINTDLLLIASLLMIIAFAALWHYRHELDVIALGKDTAINLGIPYKTRLYALLVIIALLVSISTALVGPVAFFGLLVSNLAYQIIPSYHHAYLLPGASLIAASILIGGQLILEHLIGLSTPLSIVVECLGGLTFLLLIIRGTTR
ncbi:MAG: iron chelate uptake ABC transporter family permease subunit [Cohaesibacter sp.]|nr:iron chelate uptake ABC transporter family permease subunit [Cohaesibacter sp.]